MTRRLPFFVLLAFWLSGPVAARDQIQSIPDYSYHSLDTSEIGTWWVTTGAVDPAAEVASLAAGPADRPPDGWRQVAVPRNLVKTELVESGAGKTVWYRKALRLPDHEGQAWSLRLGVITDSDRVYFNGVLIGGYGDWNSDAPQAYDRVRIYDIPDRLIRREGNNLVHIHVRGYFPHELGINRDRTAIGPSRELWHEFYSENTISTLILSFYLAVGGYFSFLFLRRRTEYENLYFGLVILFLVLYQFLRTQYKYELDIDFLLLKKIEYLSLQVLVPLFYQFIRAYFTLRGVRMVRILNWGIPVLHALIAAAFLGIAFTDSAVLWDKINTVLSQPLWGLYLIAAFSIIIRKMIRLNSDALIMFGGLLLLSILMVIDILSARGVFNLPALIPFGFILFILGFALILANRFVRLHNEADRLNIELEGQAEAFHRFVPSQFLDLLGKNEVREIGLGDSAYLKMSVLFSDLRSFTALSEDMRPEDNFKFLNSYLQRMEPGIQNHGGFVDKFVGDAIMALFPEGKNGPADPVDRSDDEPSREATPPDSSADRAVAAAIEMRMSLLEYNRHRKKNNYAPIDFGIGINSGNLMLGTVGSNDRLDTTVIGDSVNLASRIEGLTGVYHVGIILSEQARLELKRPWVYLREIDTIIVKGRHDPIIIFEMFETDEETVRDIKAETRDRFEGAIALYKVGDFDHALSIFEQLYRRNPDDRVVQLYIKRCRKLRETPPGPDWRGAVKVRFK